MASTLTRRRVGGRAAARPTSCPDSWRTGVLAARPPRRTGSLGPGEQVAAHLRGFETQRLRAPARDLGRRERLKARRYVRPIETPQHPVHDLGQILARKRRCRHPGDSHQVLAPAGYPQKFRDGPRETGRRSLGAGSVQSMAALAVERPVLPSAPCVLDARWRRPRIRVGGRLRSGAMGTSRAGDEQRYGEKRTRATSSDQ